MDDIMPATAEEVKSSAAPGRSDDEIALELMKFVAVATGYGKGGSTAGFTGKQQSRTPEEHADMLLQLFERCRGLVRQKP